jgi:DNA-directed RNA polymerase subunit omega
MKPVKVTNDTFILPSSDILNQFEYGKFVLSNLAAKRAKQLKDGAPPLVRIESNHPLTIALAEIATDKIRPVFALAEKALPPEGAEKALPEEVPLGGELGILLPSLDEVGVDLKTLPLLHEEEEFHEEEEGIRRLEELLDEEAENHVERSSEAEEGVLSLADIAEQDLDEQEE